MSRFKPSPCPELSRKCFRDEGFTLVESVMTLAILSLMIFLTVGTLDSLRSTSRLTGAQALTSAFEEARSEAMRTGAPSAIFFRKKADEFGRQEYREYGLVRQQNGVGNLVWRQLPPGVALWSGLPKTITAGTNLLAIPTVPVSTLGVPNLSPKITEQYPAMVFGDLGEIIRPTAIEAGPKGSPYYISVAEALQIEGSDTPLNQQLIEIRPATGRTQLLP